MVPQTAEKSDMMIHVILNRADGLRQLLWTRISTKGLCMSFYNDAREALSRMPRPLQTDKTLVITRPECLLHEDIRAFEALIGNHRIHFFLWLGRACDLNWAKRFFEMPHVSVIDDVAQLDAAMQQFEPQAYGPGQTAPDRQPEPIRRRPRLRVSISEEELNALREIIL